MIDTRYMRVRLLFFMISMHSVIPIYSADISLNTYITDNDFELDHYSEDKDSKSLKFLLEKSYIVHRTVDPEELKDISNHFGRTFLSTKDVVTFFADHIEFMPGTIYMLKDKTKQKTIGFIFMNQVVYNEDSMLEINFFGVDSNESNAYSLIKCMLENVISLAKRGKISTLKIDLQKNEHEQKILAYLEKFGFTFLDHPYLDNGFVGLYYIA